MLVIGLTGGIGMGKSTAARLFRRHHIPVFDADATVHRLQARGGDAIPAIARAFPGTITDGALDRARLRAEALANPAALRRLEAIIHPLVRAAQNRFLASARRHRAWACVLDVPLLFETGGDAATDLVVVVSAPACVQRERVARRRGVTRSQAAAMIARQMPDAEKRRRADVVVRTGLSKGYATQRLNLLIATLRQERMFFFEKKNQKTFTRSD